MTEPNASANAVHVYKSTGRNTINRTILSVGGEEKFLQEVVRGAESSIITNIAGLQRVTELKKLERAGSVSSPELVTGLTLINNGIASCWDYLRLFSLNFQTDGRSTGLDFFTNVTLGDKTLAVEFHFLEFFLRELRRYSEKDRDFYLNREITRRASSFAGSGLFLIFASDVKYERLEKELGIDVWSFCSCYLSTKDRMAFMNDGRQLLFDTGLHNEKTVLAFKKQFSEVFESRPSSFGAGRYNLRLSQLLQNITSGSDVVRHDVLEFNERISDYLRTVMLPRVATERKDHTGAQQAD